MKIIKKMKPANQIGKDSMVHLLGGTNLNVPSDCKCSGSIDNLNLHTGCECHS